MIKLELPDLPYSKDALQPYMSAETLELHHDKHHQAYVTNGNKFIEEQNLSESSINEIVFPLLLIFPTPLKYTLVINFSYQKFFWSSFKGCFK